MISRFDGNGRGRRAYALPQRHTPAHTFSDPSIHYPTLLHLSFYLYAFTIPFESLNVTLNLGPISLAKLTGLLVFSMSFLNFKRSYSKTSPQLLWFFVYLAFYVIRALFIESEYVSQATTAFLTIVQLLAFFWIASNLLQDEQFSRKVLLSYALGASFMTIAIRLGVPGFTLKEMHNYQGGRVTAVGVDPNYLAIVLDLAAVILVGMALNKKTRSFFKLFLIAMLILVLVLIVQTGSRGGLVGLILGMTCYVWPSGLTKHKLVPIGMVICALVSCGYLLLSDPGVVSRWTDTITKGDSAGRDVIYSDAFDMISEKPFLGWGPVEYQKELGTRTQEGIALRDPHNLTLHVLLEGGAFGGFIFLTALGLCARSAWKSRSGEFGIMLSAILIALILGLQFYNWIYSKPLWLVLAVCTGIGQGFKASQIQEKWRSRMMRRLGRVEPFPLKRFPSKA